MQPKPAVHSAPKKVLYFYLPHTGAHSLHIRTQISRLCFSAFPHLNIRFVFRPTLRLSQLFTFKDKIPKALRSCVVYSFTCRCCSATYLHTRVSEHLGVSPLTGHKSSNRAMSSILSHLDSTGHTASLNDFKTICSCSSPDELLIREVFSLTKSNRLSTYKAVRSHGRRGSHVLRGGGGGQRQHFPDKHIFFRHK